MYFSVSQRCIKTEGLDFPVLLASQSCVHSVLPNAQSEPRPYMARSVLLGARFVTCMVVGSTALFGVLVFSFIFFNLVALHLYFISRSWSEFVGRHLMTARTYAIRIIGSSVNCMLKILWV
jgi:hypothetical protein